MPGRDAPAGGAPTPRMAALARLPIFLALEGKRAVVAGEGEPVAWKAELLSAAGADVAIFAVHPSQELRALAARAPRGAITLQSRSWRPADLRGAAVAVGGFDDAREAASFAGAARAAGVPVNVIDKPACCDFIFGAIVNRSPLVIGISTDGAAPVLGQAIRAKLEALIPRGFAGWADAAGRWRPTVQSSRLSRAARLRFWQAFARLALAHPDREPAQSDLTTLLERSGSSSAVGIGSITLVGIGGGDPELLTLRAVRALQSADVILVDNEVSPGIIDFARREARKMLVDTTARSRKQDDAAGLAIALASAGKRVAWLKGGDPLIVGRAHAAVAAGIALEIVPAFDPSTIISGRAVTTSQDSMITGFQVSSPAQPQPAPAHFGHSMKRA